MMTAPNGAVIRPSTNTIPVTVRVRPGDSRFMVTVPAKVLPSAVARNRARRQIKESLRRIHAEPPAGRRCIITVRGIPLPAGRDLDEALRGILKPFPIETS